jgi:hypothetical protein
VSLPAVTVVPLWTSIVLALASPLVAAVAVWVGKRSTTAAVRQQREQLDATLAQQRDQLRQQAEQQTASLRHEREQQEQMLRHERHRDDLSEVRRVLDDAARALTQADRYHRDIYDDLGNLAKREALKNAGRTLDEVEQRLAIRFGSDHEVTRAMAACVELSLHVFGARLHWDLDDRDHARQQARRAMEEFEPAWRTFISAATRHAGVVLPDRTAINHIG